ncbi:GNAT family N-acetyltransferase [Saccharothrix sp. Mg75]|uniref:GNAT family N-acetyltransferase n=1 Tax=Saccharothrix sp. Mg75 TaxID=3445357 RepID=UPI003EEF1125
MITGHTARPPSVDDAEALFALVQAYTRAVVGFADSSLDDVRDELAEPGFVPGRDARVVFDAGGALVGYGIADARGGGHVDARRAVHAVWNASFAGQSGFEPKPCDEWRTGPARKSIFSWDDLWLAEPVGFPECTDQFLDQGCGYVGHLGVPGPARGRGVGRYLLRHAFHRDAAAGRAGTLLHVDSANPTPALGLYGSGRHAPGAGARRVAGAAAHLLGGGRQGVAGPWRAALTPGCRSSTGRRPAPACRRGSPAPDRRRAGCR